MSLHLAMLAPFAVAVVFAAFVRRLARAFPPAHTVRLVSAISVVIAVATGFAAAVAAFTFVAQYPRVAALGDWSARSLRRVDPVSPALGAFAAVTVIACGVAAVFVVVRYVRALVSTLRAFRGLGPDAHGLVVVDDARADAFTLPGATGRVVRLHGDASGVAASRAARVARP